MEMLMLLIYVVLCIVVFKVFCILFNKWIVLMVVFGGIVLIGVVIFGMNYNFFYIDVGNQVFCIVLIVLQVCGWVQSVLVKFNQMLYKGDVLFIFDLMLFQVKVDDLQVQIKVVSQDVFFLNVVLSQVQVELSRVVVQCDQLW